MVEPIGDTAADLPILQTSKATSPESNAIGSRQPTHPIKSISEAVVIFGALAFVTGWSYVSSYLSSFGFSPLEVDLSTSLASVMAVHALYGSVWPVIGLCVVTAAAMAIRSVSPEWSNSTSVVAPALFGSLVALAITGTLLGQYNARRDMSETTSRLPSVGFDTDLPGDYPRCVTDGIVECRLLVHWKQAYYFFEPIKAGGGPISGTSIQIFVVPESHVKFARMLKGYD